MLLSVVAVILPAAFVPSRHRVTRSMKMIAGDERTGWTDGDPTGSARAISVVAHSGDKSVKLTENGAYVSQTIAVQRLRCCQ